MEFQPVVSESVAEIHSEIRKMKEEMVAKADKLIEQVELQTATLEHMKASLDGVGKAVNCGEKRQDWWTGEQ
jgi:uncharacterized protein YoxC